MISIVLIKNYRISKLLNMYFITAMIADYSINRITKKEENRNELSRKTIKRRNI